MRWPRSGVGFGAPVRVSAADHWGQKMNISTNAGPFAPPKRKRNINDWLERAKLVVAAARDRAVEMAQQREAPPMTHRPTVLQRRRLAQRLSARS
jgi:hypothetical protein